MVARLKAGRSVARIPAGQEVCLRNVQTGFWGLSSLQCNGYRGYFRGVRQPGRENDQLPLSIGHVIDNEWCCTPTVPTCIRGMHSKNFAFTFDVGG
jgi:hypothetical protein